MITLSIRYHSVLQTYLEISYHLPLLSHLGSQSGNLFRRGGGSSGGAGRGGRWRSRLGRRSLTGKPSLKRKTTYTVNYISNSGKRYDESTRRSRLKRDNSYLQFIHLLLLDLFKKNDWSSDLMALFQHGDERPRKGILLLGSLVCKPWGGNI